MSDGTGGRQAGQQASRRISTGPSITGEGFDVEIYATLDELVRGKLKTGGNAVWDLSDGAVGLGTISLKLPRSLVVARMEAKMASGRTTPRRA